MNRRELFGAILGAPVAVAVAKAVSDAPVSTSLSRGSSNLLTGSGADQPLGVFSYIYPTSLADGTPVEFHFPHVTISREVA